MTRTLIIKPLGGSVEFSYRDYDGVERARVYDIETVSPDVARERLKHLEFAIREADRSRRETDAAWFQSLAKEIENKQRELEALRVSLARCND